MSRYVSLAVFAALTAVASTLGALFMPDAWYVALAKPAWTPPNWLFGPVWTVLYVMIAIAGWLVWRAGGWSAAVVAWGMQMAFNAAWSFLFFGQKNIALALADITMMWFSIVAFIALSWSRSRAAALLFVPYLLWVSYATALNFSIWKLNP